MAQKIALIIPTYNDKALFLKFFAQVQSRLFKLKADSLLEESNFTFIIVDDGSQFPLCREDLASSRTDSMNVYLLKHSINLGQGAALSTGIQFALESLDCEYFVTLDADGQHSIDDLTTLINPVLKGDVDIVFGNRFLGNLSSEIPWFRRLVLIAARYFENVLTRTQLSDAHNGYRAFNRRTALLFKLKHNRMAHATEIKQIVAKHDLRYTQTPVSIHYNEEVLAKGQSSFNAVNILKELVKNYIFGKG